MAAVLDFIVRALQGRGTRSELGRLAAWRRASLDNERYFRLVERIWWATGIARPGALPPPPGLTRELIAPPSDRLPSDVPPPGERPEPLD